MTTVGAAGVIEIVGPPRRRIYVSGLGPDRNDGWEIVIEEMDAAGDWQPRWDTFEDRFEDVARYLMAWAPWLDPDTGEAIDLQATVTRQTQ